jgi:mannose-6-phosphate isomerase-like protein (cupin superfamily)
MFIKNVASLAKFTPDKMGKSDLCNGESLFAGLNSFEPGQEHALHSHAGQDKLYFILEGSGVAKIGDEEQPVAAGDAAFAASGVPHSMKNTGTTRLVVMAILAPPPAAK